MGGDATGRSRYGVFMTHTTIDQTLAACLTSRGFAELPFQTPDRDAAHAPAVAPAQTVQACPRTVHPHYTNSRLLQVLALA